MWSSVTSVAHAGSGSAAPAACVLCASSAISAGSSP